MKDVETAKVVVTVNGRTENVRRQCEVVDINLVENIVEATVTSQIVETEDLAIRISTETIIDRTGVRRPTDVIIHRARKNERGAGRVLGQLSDTHTVVKRSVVMIELHQLVDQTWNRRIVSLSSKWPRISSVSLNVWTRSHPSSHHPIQHPSSDASNCSEL
jgi:hypothetical protein